MKIPASGIAVLALCLFGLARPAQPAEPDPEADSVRKAIEVEEAKFARAEMRGDLDAMTQMYSDADLGKEAVAARFARFRNSSASLVSERFEMTSLDVCGDLAVESGEIVTQLETSARSTSTDRARYLSVWRHRPDGTWKVARGLWSPTAVSEDPPIGSPEPRPTSELAAPAAAAVPPTPADFVPIPDARSLSDGFVRTIQDNLKSTAHRLRSLAGSAPEKQRKAAAKADRDLQALIRDVGWIDVGRFGVLSSCDAAYIVSRSGDLALMRATLPLMEKDLNHSGNDPLCYKKALEAYQALAIR
jgi:ketosteroid isomerase-like protein